MPNGALPCAIPQVVLITMPERVDYEKTLVAFSKVV